MHDHENLHEQGISRRGFLTGAAMVGAGAALGLAGCSGSPEVRPRRLPGSEAGVGTGCDDVRGKQPARVPPRRIPFRRARSSKPSTATSSSAARASAACPQLAAENGANVHVVEG
ncbi:MAG: twin-arginine translocation signal domain-containing protein [Eggerthella lenta]